MERAFRVSVVHGQFLELAQEIQELARSKVNLGANFKGVGGSTKGLLAEEGSQLWLQGALSAVKDGDHIAFFLFILPEVATLGGL